MLSCIKKIHRTWRVQGTREIEKRKKNLGDSLIEQRKSADTSIGFSISIIL